MLTSGFINTLENFYCDIKGFKRANGGYIDARSTSSLSACLKVR